MVLLPTGYSHALRGVDAENFIGQLVDVSPVKEPSSMVAGLFLPGGDAFIIGGVAVEGRVTFILDAGAGSATIPADQIGMQVTPQGKVALVYRGDYFTMEIHKGLACPLASFTVRDGRYLYSLPPREASTSKWNELGLVPYDGGGRIAKEFLHTGLEMLLVKADFVQDESLPNNQMLRLRDSINSSNGVSSSFSPIGNYRSDLYSLRFRFRNSYSASYINVDKIVRYKSYLELQRHIVDTAGAPLRFYWTSEPGKPAAVDYITVIATSNMHRQPLYDFNVPPQSDREVPDYDAVVLYQNAAIFRQLHQSNPSMFKEFERKACRPLLK